MERKRIQGLPQFFEYPRDAQKIGAVPGYAYAPSQERVKLRTSNLAGIFTGSIRTKAL